MVPRVFIFTSPRNRPWRAIKGGRHPPPHSTPPRPPTSPLEDVMQQLHGEALPRLVLRIGRERERERE
jgi:hypothetical protein